jgi:copper transport protein
MFAIHKQSWHSWVLVALASAMMALAWPVAPVQAQARHALPVSYYPAENAVLKTPPAQVQILFSEHVNPDISKIVVVNPSNQEVDNRDSQVSADGYTMTVTLPLLAAGTYVVAWRTHSADDGHIAGGSYIFHIARADGTVPPLTGPLPSGNIVGGAGGAPTALNGPTLLQTLVDWVAHVALTLLLGLIFWWVVVMPRQPSVNESFRTRLVTSFGQAADLALEAIIGSTLVFVVLQALIVNGTAQGFLSWPLISGILFQSRQGTFLVARLGLAVLGLVCLWVPQIRTSLRPENQRLVSLLFGVLVSVAFVYSGHGGAGTQWWSAPNDLLHLLANGVWLGGLLTLAFLIIPALRTVSAEERQRYLAEGLPAFSLPALVAVAALLITGPFNATVRMTSFAQLWTTAYGIVLLVKIGLFLAMIGISYEHAFRLRPRLAQQVGLPAHRTLGTWQRLIPKALQQRFLSLVMPAAGNTSGATLAMTAASSADLPTNQVASTTQDQRLPQRIAWWLRIEALLGLGVLLCAVLLAPLAGTLAPSIVTTASFGATGGNQTFTQTVDQLTVNLSITPGHFGTNQVTVVVKNPDGTFASQGTVFVLTQMVEMDMGENSFTLQETSQPGTYEGNVELPMAGHWQLTTVIQTHADPQHQHRTTFTVGVAF